MGRMKLNFTDNISELQTGIAEVEKALGLNAFAAEVTVSRGGALSALTVSKQVLYQDLLLGLFDKNFEGIGLAAMRSSREKDLCLV